ncbi:MAG TPA: DUF1800 domain-containing protein [Pirellulales bacterium]
MSLIDATTAATWAPYEPSDAEPWNLARVVHLHRRAGFGASWQVIQRDLRDGPAKSIDRLLNAQADRAAREPFESLARTIGDAATASGNAGRLKAWWLYRMLLSPDPLGERLTLMWHNHFATSNRKVQDLSRMREQNDLFRQHSRGRLADLLSAVVKHPAMLVWLDADSNRKGHANENLARELMELFTLGVGHYTESDVKEAARALTGWGIVENQFGLQPVRHDDGEKVVLGRRGNLSGDELLELLVAQPATARRVAWRIANAFLGEHLATDEAIDALAAGLRERDLDLDWAVTTLLRSQRFFSAENLRARVASPVDFVVGALSALELNASPPSTLLLADWTARMGQELFYPPNVGGWREGRGWLSSRTIVARASFAAALARGELWSPAQAPALAALCERHGVAVELESAVRWFADLLWGEAPTLAVEEVVTAAAEAPEAERLGRAVALLLARPESQMN